MRLARHRFTALFLLSMFVVSTLSNATGPDDAAPLHEDFDRMLKAHVVETHEETTVDYAAWSADPQDSQALERYVEDLSALDPTGWPRSDGLAYWINLYNAVTLRLILDNYPLKSITDLGDDQGISPWQRELVVVAGRKLSLNAIENEIIRPTFKDPRVHFALNCASLGCPPLKAGAYGAVSLSDQLDAACRSALNRESWVRIEGDTVLLTKVFEWYREDFETGGLSVEAFINRFRDQKLSLSDGSFSFMPYDWRLNGRQGR